MRFFVTHGQMEQIIADRKRSEGFWNDAAYRAKMKDLEQAISIARFSFDLVLKREMDAAFAFDQAKLLHDKITELVPK